MAAAIVPAIVSTAISTGVAYVTGTAITATLIGTTFLTNLALYGAQAALAGDAPDGGDPSGSNEMQGRNVTTRLTNATRKLVYGAPRIGGNIVFMDTSGGDEYLHMVIAMAPHRLQEFTTIYFDDRALTISSNNVTSPSRYNGHAKVFTVTEGTGSNQPSLLISSTKWTSNHKLTDQAYIYVRLQFDEKAFGDGGIPNVSAIVQGRRVYDPRTTSTAYSQNPALVIRDYLTDATYGLGASASEIDDTSFIAAANICDENVAIDGGGTQKRYLFDGVIDTADSPRSNLRKMLTSLGGALYYSNGKWEIKAGAYVTPTVTLDEDDLAGGLTITTANSGRESFNTVKGQYISPRTQYELTDYPPITNATFKSDDLNEERILNLNLPFTSDRRMAQRIAKQYLFRSRQEIAVNARFKMSAFQFNVGDTVMITNARLGWTQKVFEVGSWKLAFNDKEAFVDCALIETNSAVYDWNAEEQDFEDDDTDLPNPFDLPVPTITASDDLEIFNQQAISVLVVDVSSTSVYARDFEVEAKLSTETIYKTLGRSSGSRFTLVNVKNGGTYDIRARIRNNLNVTSEYATAQHTISGTSVAPSDITALSVNINGQQADLTWTAVPDGDLSHYVIRHSPLTTGATFDNARTVAKKVSRPATSITVPAQTGTYLIKAVDKFGFYSANEASSVALVDQIDLNVSDTLTEHTAFTGSKTTCVVVDDTLRLDTTNLFDSVAGNFDDATGLFGGGVSNIASSGTYDFANYIDLTDVFTAQASATLKFTQFSQHTGTPATAAADVELYVSTTQDDPAGSPTWTAYRQFVVGSYTARAFRFRAILTSLDSQETPAISELTAQIKLPTRTQSDNDIQSGAGAKAITFTNAFKVLRAVSISVGDMQSGDYYGITSKSATGFTITFYNSSDVAVDRLFDYVATGF